MLSPGGVNVAHLACVACLAKPGRGYERISDHCKPSILRKQAVQLDQYYHRLHRLLSLSINRLGRNYHRRDSPSQREFGTSRKERIKRTVKHDSDSFRVSCVAAIFSFNRNRLLCNMGTNEGGPRQELASRRYGIWWPTSAFPDRKS